jgi:hypothetical protein
MPGTVFLWKDKYFMKTVLGSGVWNAVNLESGNLQSFVPETPVFPKSDAYFVAE